MVILILSITIDFIEKKFGERLKQLRNLKDGWDYGAKAVKEETINASKHFLLNLFTKIKKENVDKIDLHLFLEYDGNIIIGTNIETYNEFFVFSANIPENDDENIIVEIKEWKSRKERMFEFKKMSFNDEIVEYLDRFLDSYV